MHEGVVGAPGSAAHCGRHEKAGLPPTARTNRISWWNCPQSFERLASTKDTERLFSMLPYKTLSFSQIKEQGTVHTR